MVTLHPDPRKLAALLERRDWNEFLERVRKDPPKVGKCGKDCIACGKGKNK